MSKDQFTRAECSSTLGQQTLFTQNSINKKFRHRLAGIPFAIAGSTTSVSFAFACVALVLPAISGFSVDTAWAQDSRRAAPQQAQPSPRQLPRGSSNAARLPLRTAPAAAVAAATTGSAGSPATAAFASSDTPFGAALLSCDKEQEEDALLALPGLKGEIKLDRCYRGRSHLSCRFDTVLAEQKALVQEFTRIAEERYPEVNNVEEICKRSFDSLVKDAGGAAEFAKRFSASRSEYDARTSCANKIKQSVQETTLPDLVQAPELLKSINETLDLEVKKVSAVQEQISGLAHAIELSEKSLAALQKIHRAICLKSKNQVQAQRPDVSN
jgi:hypothetical protein